MKVIVELVRGLFVLSMMAFLLSIAVTLFWLFQGHANWNPNSTTSNNVAHGFRTLQSQAWGAVHVWLLVSVGLFFVSMLLALLWRYCFRRIKRGTSD